MVLTYIGLKARSVPLLDKGAWQKIIFFPTQKARQKQNLRNTGTVHY